MLLARFGRRIAPETRIDNLLTIIAEEVRHILNADRCSVFLLDSARKELWTKVALGVGEKVLRIPIGQGIAGFVCKTGSAVNIRDAYRDTRFTQDFDKITGYQTKTVLAVPLKDLRDMQVIPAVIQENGSTAVATSRVQRVDPRQDPFYAALIGEFEALTGLPVVLNTSVNIREPIVTTPEEAVSTFLRSAMDALALGPFLVPHPSVR